MTRLSHTQAALQEMLVLLRIAVVVTRSISVSGFFLSFFLLPYVFDTFTNSLVLHDRGGAKEEVCVTGIQTTMSSGLPLPAPVTSITRFSARAISSTFYSAPRVIMPYNTEQHYCSGRGRGATGWLAGSNTTRPRSEPRIPKHAVDILHLLFAPPIVSLAVFARRNARSSFLD